MTAEEQLSAFEELLEWLKSELIKRGWQVEETGGVFEDWFEIGAARHSSRDYYVARGWYDKMLVHLKNSAGDKTQLVPATAAGRNMLDAVYRMSIYIGIDKAAVDDFLQARGFKL